MQGLQRKQEEARYRQEYQGGRLASNRPPDRRVAARPRDPRLRLVVEEDANAPGEDFSPDSDLGRWFGWASDTRRIGGGRGADGTRPAGACANVACAVLTAPGGRVVVALINPRDGGRTHGGPQCP